MEWISLDNKMPEKGIDIKIKESDGLEHYAYLCNCCGKCWRSPFGGGLIVNPTHWRELSEDEKIIYPDQPIDIMKYMIENDGLI